MSRADYPIRQILPEIERLSTEWKGTLSDLETCIGLLFVGHTFGSEGLRAAHSWTFLSRHSKALGYRTPKGFLDSLPKRGRHTRRLVVVRLADDIRATLKEKGLRAGTLAPV